MSGDLDAPTVVCRGGDESSPSIWRCQMRVDNESERRADGVIESGQPRMRVWDISTRIFHWLLVVLVAIGLYTGLTGGFQEMDWHVKSGIAILTLLVFRVVWGVVGSRRFPDRERGIKSSRRTVVAGANPVC